MSGTQGYRTIVALDIERFGRPDRDDRIRVELRRRLRTLLDSVLTGAGVAAPLWSATSTGDGLLVLVNPTLPTAQVLRGLLDRLPGELDRYNRSATKLATQMRLRVVLHAAHIMFDEQGAVGEQVNLVFRLLNSAMLRDCLSAVGDPAVIAVSDDVYQQVVRHRPLDLDPGKFQQVQFSSKPVFLQTGPVFLQRGPTALLDIHIRSWPDNQSYRRRSNSGKRGDRRA